MIYNLWADIRFYWALMDEADRRYDMAELMRQALLRGSAVYRIEWK